MLLPPTWTEYLPVKVPNKYTSSGYLSSEKVVIQSWDLLIFLLAWYAVSDVDQNNVLPATQVTGWALHSKTREALLSPAQALNPVLTMKLRLVKFWCGCLGYSRTSRTHRRQQLGTSLTRRMHDINIKVIPTPSLWNFNQKITASRWVSSWSVGGIWYPEVLILFGGHKFMLHSLFCNADTLGEVHFCLASSDIIDCTDLARKPFAVYLYSSRKPDGPAQLSPPTSRHSYRPTPAVSGVNRSQVCRRFHL